MGKIQNIQALRGIAVLSVVFYHLLTIEKKYGGSTTILPDFLQFGMFGVDLFFVISGFVMVTVTRGKFQNLREALRFIYHRTARIYPTYWFYSILVLIVFIIHPAWVNNSQGNQVDILASFLLFPSHTLPLVMVGWTLIHEMYFYLIFFSILLLVPEKNLTHAILLWAGIVLSLNFFVVSSNPLFNILCHPLTLEFMGGCLIAHAYYSKKVELKSIVLFAIAALSIFVLLYGYLSSHKTSGIIEPTGWWRIVVLGIPALMIVFCATNLERNGHVIHSSLRNIGDASYSIYLSHLLTLSAAGRIWSMFSTDRVIDNIIMLPVLLMLVLMAGGISYLVVEHPLHKLTRNGIPGAAYLSRISKNREIL